MKWKDLTPEQLESLALDIHDQAHDQWAERKEIMAADGWDVVSGMKAVARYLEREARRRRKEPR